MIDKIDAREFKKLTIYKMYISNQLLIYTRTKIVIFLI